ncbi:MAG: hypothetical protein J5814_09855 [Bacteroidaceae bacterium]|nr:hypothetical protein [Bacteroidaceae bacterium]
MKKTYFVILLTTIIFALSACTHQKGKSVYIPEDLRDYFCGVTEVPDDSIRTFDKTHALLPDTARWSFSRCRLTDNFAVFWERGFGNDISKAPELDGHPMCVDLDNLCSKLESFYDYYYHTLQFVHPGSLCDKYRMMVMINYSLEGTAYGGDYDGVIGALWVAPNRIQDKSLNCIAHELGHCFQSQIMCDGTGEAWGGSGFFEMTSQWMLWQVNPDWIGSEKYHWDAFCKLTHKAFLDGANIYHSPYVIEYWSMKRGLMSIGDLYRAGKRGDDPVITYKELYGLSQSQFCDEMYEAVAHTVNLDYPRCWELTRPYACQMAASMDALDSGALVPSADNIPENYGYNVINFTVPIEGKKLEVHLKALPALATRMRGGWFSPSHQESSDDAQQPELREPGEFRFGFVAVADDGTTVYGPMQSGSEGSVTYTGDGKTQKLFLVVMAAPKEHSAPFRRMIPVEDTSDDTVPTIPSDHFRPAPRYEMQYPYEITFS